MKILIIVVAALLGVLGLAAVIELLDHGHSPLEVTLRDGWVLHIKNIGAAERVNDFAPPVVMNLVSNSPVSGARIFHPAAG